jgi:hypothetical protein
MSEEESRPSKFWESVFPGLGIGLLVGFLVGLSVSPVVSGLLTTLGGLLAAILGIQPGGDAETARFRVNGTRIGAFGLACVLGVLGGMTLRIRDVLAVPMEKQVAKWVAAGFDTKEAQRLAVFQKTGLLASTQEGGKVELSASELPKAQASVLFNALSEVDLCEKVNLDQFGSDPKNQAEQMFGVYRRLHASQSQSKYASLYRMLAETADRAQTQPLPAQIEVLTAVEKTVCAVQAIE